MARDDRRYSDDEFRWILSEATQEEVRGPAEVLTRQEPRDGYSLSEIQEIAREVNIDPAAVQRAARTLAAPVLVSNHRKAEGPFNRVLICELVVDRSLSDRELRMVALEAERVLGRPGSVRRRSDFAEWHDEEGRFSVHVVRVGQATRIRVTCDQSSDLVTDSGILVGGGLIATGAAVMAAAPWSFVAVPLVVGAATGLIWVTAVGRSAITREHLRKLMEQLGDLAMLAEGPDRGERERTI